MYLKHVDMYRLAKTVLWAPLQQRRASHTRPQLQKANQDTFLKVTSLFAPQSNKCCLFVCLFFFSFVLLLICFCHCYFDSGCCCGGYVLLADVLEACQKHTTSFGFVILWVVLFVSVERGWLWHCFIFWAISVCCVFVQFCFYYWLLVCCEAVQ